MDDLDLSEHLAKYRDQNLVVTIASVGKAGEAVKARYVCGICGFAMTELGECPRCRLQVEETAKGLRQRQQRDALLREIDEFVEGKWDDPDGPERVV